MTAGDAILQVPLTYRDEPLDEVEAALLTEMDHSMLGTRWVYDALGDPLFPTVLAGQAESMLLARVAELERRAQ